MMKWFYSSSQVQISNCFHNICCTKCQNSLSIMTVEKTLIKFVHAWTKVHISPKSQDSSKVCCKSKFSCYVWNLWMMGKMLGYLHNVQLFLLHLQLGINCSMELIQAWEMSTNVDLDNDPTLFDRRLNVPASTVRRSRLKSLTAAERRSRQVRLDSFSRLAPIKSNHC